jgi:Tol biopolymer transport system component
MEIFETGCTALPAPNRCSTSLVFNRICSRKLSGQRRLTSEGKNSEPVWSPDGRRIAFVSVEDLYVMSADGSRIVRLTGDRNARSFSWSPDSARIVVGTYRYQQGVTVLTAPGQPVIIVITSGNEVRTIEVMNAEGGARRAISVAPGDSDPVWSPDGRRIAFLSSRDENWQLYAMNPDGSGVIRLTSEGANDSPVWSRDSRRIAFVVRGDGIHVANADSRGQTRVTEVGISPAWSPDGRRLAFVSYDGGGFRQIFVINADGSGETQLTKDAP